MAIKALKAGVESWDKDLNRYIDSNLIPKYYPMEDYLRHLPKWNGKHDYVGELARRVKTQALGKRLPYLDALDGGAVDGQGPSAW